MFVFVTFRFGKNVFRSNEFTTGTMTTVFEVVAEWNFAAPELPVDNGLFCAIVLVLLVLFIWLIARFTSSATEDIDPAEVDRRMLTAVTELKSRGELTTEEYRSIKSQLVGRLSDDSSSAGGDDSSHEDKHSKELKNSERQTAETREGTRDSDDVSMGNNPRDTEDRISEKDQNEE